MEEKFTVKEKEVGRRLDIFCHSKLAHLSRGQIQKAIKSGEITVNGREVKPKQATKAGDDIEINIVDELLGAKMDEGQEKNPLSLPILFEDEDLVVVNKPAGVLVHATANSREQTVASWFENRYSAVLEAGVWITGRSGIVHRLDRDTSGVMVLAKTRRAQASLNRQFKKHYVVKEYLALVFGTPTMTDGRINQAIIRSRSNPSRRTVVPKKDKSLLTGKMAITEWKIERKYEKYCLIRVKPLTGRTHQIRVHLHFLGYPIVGDSLYTFKRQKSPAGAKRQLLHAERLTIQLVSGRKRTFEAPLPEDFQGVLSALGKGMDMTNRQEILGFRTPSSFKAKKTRK